MTNRSLDIIRNIILVVNVIVLGILCFSLMLSGMGDPGIRNEQEWQQFYETREKNTTIWIVADILFVIYIFALLPALSIKFYGKVLSCILAFLLMALYIFVLIYLPASSNFFCFGYLLFGALLNALLLIIMIILIRTNKGAKV